MAPLDIENTLPDKDVFCLAIEYNRCWAKLDSSDELHVLHPDLSTNAAIEFGYSMGLKYEKVVVLRSPNG